MKKYLHTLFVFFLASLASPLFSQEEAKPNGDKETDVHHEMNVHQDFFSNDIQTPREILEKEALEAESHNFYIEFLRMLLILGFIIAFLFLLSWAVKRLLNTKMQGINRDSLIKILETRPISNKSSIHLIEVLGKGLVIGESLSGIVLLADIPLEPDEDEPAS